MDVVDAGIVWIWQQKKRLINSVLVFSRIRSVMLSQGDRNTIRERLKTLPNGEKVWILIWMDVKEGNYFEPGGIQSFEESALIILTLPDQNGSFSF